MRSLIFVLTVFITAVSSEVPAAQKPLARRLQAWVTPYAADGRFSGAVLVAQDGRIVFEKGYGLANVEWNAPNTPATKFNIASLTKQFTALAVLQLVQQGRISLSDPVARFYEKAPESWRGITVAHLLAHRSGIPTLRDSTTFRAESARRTRRASWSISSPRSRSTSPPARTGSTATPATTCSAT